MAPSQVFISYAGRDRLVAELLQFAAESILAHMGLKVWTFQRDQDLSEREIATSIKERMRESQAAVLIVSPETLLRGATQWMELAYADAFEIPTFVLLHHITYAKLKAEDADVPPLLLAGQCTSSSEWRNLIDGIGRIIVPGDPNGKA